MPGKSRLLRACLVAVITSTLTLESLVTGSTGFMKPAAAQASTTPILEFQRDAARAAWVSGPGGNYFGIWSCPQGSVAVGVRGAESGGYVFRFGLVCRYIDLNSGTWGAYAYTPTTHSGAMTELRCPSGQALVRVDIWTMSTFGYPIASETEPYCQFLDFGDMNASPRQVPQLTGAIAHAPNRYFGVRHGSLFGRANCGAGKFVVAIDGRRGALLDGLGIYCGRFTSSAATISNVTLSGSTQFGVPITATPTAAGGPAPTMTYQWYRCNTSDATTKATIPAPPECELIDGATNASYAPQITDYGQHLRVVATATNFFGSASIVSPTTPAPAVPAPTIDLPDDRDSGSSATDNHTNEQRPTFHLGRLVPTATVTVTATKPGETPATCTFTAGGVPNDATGAPATGQCPMLTNLTDGEWTVTASQTYTPPAPPADDPNNPPPAPAPITSDNGSMSVMIDATPPVIGPLNVRLNGSTGTPITDGGAIAVGVSNTFWLGRPTATDAHTGTVITCSIDGGPYTVCPTSYRNLTPGSHTLTVRAVDRAGNESTRNHTWFVVTPPVVNLDPASDSGHSNTDTNTNDNTPRILVSGLVVGATVTVTATLSGQTNRTCTFTATAAVNGCDDWKIGAATADLSDGTWRYSATQRYDPGSGTAATSSVSNVRNVVVDTQTPTFTSWSSYNNAGTIINGNVVRSVPSWTHHIRPIWADQPVSNRYLWHGTCSHNGGSLRTLTSTSTTHVCSVVGPPSGLHTMVFTRTDIAGNKATPQTFQWTVLNTPVLALDPASDTGSSNSDHITADNTPTMQVGDLAPGATVTVTATRSGFPRTTCTFTAPAAVAPATASSGSCDLPELGDATGWSIRASQSMPQAAPSTASVTQLSNIVSLTIDTRRSVITAPLVYAGTSAVSSARLANDAVTARTEAVMSRVIVPTGETAVCKLNGTVVPCPTTNTTFRNLTPGPQVFEVIGTDRAGNVGVTSFNWRVIETPVVRLATSSDSGRSDSDAITNDHTPTMEVTNLSPGAAVTVTATKDGETPVTCTFTATATAGNCDLPSMVDGTWSVSATQRFGTGASAVTSSPSVATAVTVDTAAPVQPTLALTGVTNGGIVPPTTVIGIGEPTSPGSTPGDVVIECSLNGATPGPCPVTLSGLADGPYSLTVVATDTAGNVASTQQQWFVLGTPIVGLDDPAAGLNSLGQVVTSSATQAPNLTGLTDGATVTVTASGPNGLTATCNFQAAGTSGSCDLGALADGTWTVSATQEIGGNTSPAAAPFNIVVDRTAPVLTVELRDAASNFVAGTGMTSGGVTTESTLSLNTTATDADSAITYTCILDGVNLGNCPSQLNGLGYGQHELVVKAVDTAGNEATSTTTWMVAAPPVVALASASDSGATASDGITNVSAPVIEISNLGDNVDVVVTASKAGETDVQCFVVNATSQATCQLGFLVDGNWTVTARQGTTQAAARAAGYDFEALRSVASVPTPLDIDTVSPAGLAAAFSAGGIAITSGDTTGATNLAIAGLAATDRLAVTYACTLDSQPAVSPCPAEFTGLGPGVHRLVVTATDLAGNVTASTLNWTVMGAPSVNLAAASDTGSSNADGITNAVLPDIEVSNLIPGALVTVTGTKAGQDDVTCTFIAPAPTGNEASSTGSCALGNLASDGPWAVTAVQSLPLGATSTASVPATVTLDTTPPAMGTPGTGLDEDGASVSVLINPDISAVAAGTAVSTGSGTESQDITLTLPGKETSATRVCELNGMAHDCAVTALTGMVTGVHTFTITDNDLAGNTAAQSFVWSVVGMPTVALVPSSDSGAADFITNIETPEFTAGALIAGAAVEITATNGNQTRSCSFVAIDGVTACALPPLSDGVWSVTSRQGFGSGWSAPSTAVNLTIDATGPTDLAVALTSGGRELTFHGEVVDDEGEITPADETAAASSTVALSAPTSTDTHAVTYTCSLNGAAAVPCPAEFSGLPSGVNNLVLTATDVAGNSSTLIRDWSVIAAPVVTLAVASDTGVVGDGITAEQLPFFDVSNVMPGATVTVTATKSGSAPVTCTFTAPSVAPPARSSAGSCQAGASISGPGWSVTATQAYTTTTSDLADRVTLTSAASAPFALDVVQPHAVTINAPTEVSVAEGSLSLESLDPRSLPMSFLEVTLTSLTPSVCTINTDGDVVLLRPGTCILRGTAPGGDDGAGTFFDTGIRTVSLAVLPVNTVTTLPAAAVSFAGAAVIELPRAPVGSNRPATPANAGSGSQAGAGPTRGIKPPPPPVRFETEALPGNRRANVTVTVNQGRPGAPVRGVVLMVFDETGAQRHRVAVDVAPGATIVTAQIPFRENYQVRAFTTNDAGVSNRAPIGANVLSASTTRGKRPDGTPILFGKKIAKPILFDPDSPDLNAQSRKVLDGVVKYSQKNGGRVFITGFVRNQGGDPRFQKRLSSDRAQQVAQYLSARGVKTWIRFNGYGPFRNGQGLPQDRRVEVRWSAGEIPNLKQTRANALFAGPEITQGSSGL